MLLSFLNAGLNHFDKTYEVTVVKCYHFSISDEGSVSKISLLGETK